MRSGTWTYVLGHGEAGKGLGNSGENLLGHPRSVEILKANGPDSRPWGPWPSHPEVQPLWGPYWFLSSWLAGGAYWRLHPELD